MQAQRPRHPPLNAETLLFEAGLPGIDEETVFRAAFVGYLPAASSGKGSAGWRQRAAPVLLGALLFCPIHALRFDPSPHPHVDAAAFAYTALIGAGHTVLTLNSGSILPPVLTHDFVICLGMRV